MVSTDDDYFKERAKEEARLATLATTTPEAAVVHTALAKAYRTRLARLLYKQRDDARHQRTASSKAEPMTGNPAQAR